MRKLNYLVVTIVVAAISACAPQNAPLPQPGPTAALPKTASQRSPQQQRLGDENHAKIMQKYGGAYPNARLTSYVNEIGRRLAVVSEQPRERWTFTVLDSPTVNAFALPGGYVYVTRGLVALANSEAELAGVVGHEIGHVTAGHSSLRQERGTIATGALLGVQVLGAILGADPNLIDSVSQVGKVAAAGVLAIYSREDELAADNLGIRYILRAGYDPYAQADFLESMSASSSLDARMKGRSYNPNATDFFASHPATGPRTRRAIEVAAASGETVPVGANRGRDSLLSIIDGMTFGDSAKQGFVRGRTFSHPELRFTYTVPPGFTITNSASAVLADGPANSRFILDGAPNPRGALTNYITGQWVQEIAKQTRVGRPTAVQRRRINGLEAASARLPLQIDGKAFEAILVAIRHDGSLYRLTGFAPRGSSQLPAIAAAAETFRRLSSSEASRLKPLRLEVITVRPGDTISSLAARMNEAPEFREQRFRVLNGLAMGGTLQVGQKVKIVR